MTRILVVYCSRTGNTRRIAKEVAAGCGADLEEITEARLRQGPIGYLRSALESLFGIRPPIASARHDPHAYELIVIGTPIWFWNMASPVRSYLWRHRSVLPPVAFLVTCGGSGGEKVLDDLETLGGHPPVATLVLTEREIARRHYSARLLRFLRDIRRPGAQPTGATTEAHA